MLDSIDKMFVGNNFDSKQQETLFEGFAAGMEAMINGLMESIAQADPEKETAIATDPKKTEPVKTDPKKPAKLLKWPSTLNTLAEKDEDDLADEPQSLQQLLATIFDGLFIQ